MVTITRIDPFSLSRTAALLGILWAILGWFMNGLVIAFLMQGSPEEAATLPPAFAIAGLLSGIMGGVIGGAISGYLGAVVYNLFADMLGGVKIEMEEKTPVPPQV